VTGRGARRACLRSGIRGRRSSGWTSTVVVLGALAAAVSVAVGPASADPSIRSKREQAQAIVAQVQQLDADLAQTIESWNYANIELDRVDGELDTNARHLVTAKKSLVVAQKRISTRLRDLYVDGSGDSTLEVLLGARSLDEVVARLDAIQRVSRQDTVILRSVKRFKKEVETRRTELRVAREDQARIVAERAAQKASIEDRLAERERLLGSVKDEIARLQAEERARQARLAAEARARLQAQQLALLQAQNEAVAPSYELDAVIPSAPPPDGDRASQVIGFAMQYLGVPYVWGGASPSEGFDCSGLITYVYAQIGISLPHHAASQYYYGTPVSRDELQPADLVFFNGLGHMGMYIGGGQFIHAPHTGDVVKISSLYEDWYASSYVGARRIL
jgi:cell wall-associated NlpC family hydrolase